MVLVTGGTGFLGAYIIRELVENDFAVRAIHRNGPMPFFLPTPSGKRWNGCTAISAIPSAWKTPWRE
jgi:nucleoside-diphosphate-sugar epimerase